MMSRTLKSDELEVLQKLTDMASAAVHEMRNAGHDFTVFEAYSVAGNFRMHFEIVGDEVIVNLYYGDEDQPSAGIKFRPDAEDEQLAAMRGDVLKFADSVGTSFEINLPTSTQH